MHPCQYFSLALRLLSEFNFYVRVRTYEKRVTGMQPLVLGHSNFNNTLFQWFCGFFGTPYIIASNKLSSRKTKDFLLMGHVRTTQ